MALLTQKAILSTFEEMLEEMPFDKITVSALVRRCGVSSNTFYYHYQDIPALMEEILTEQIDDIIEKYSGTDSLDEFFDVSFGFVLENKRALYHMYCSSNREYFEQMLMKTCEYIVTNYMGRLFKEAEMSEADRDIMVRFITHSCFGAFIGWMMDGMKDDVMDDVHRIRYLLRGFLDNALYNKE